MNIFKDINIKFLDLFLFKINFLFILLFFQNFIFFIKIKLINIILIWIILFLGSKIENIFILIFFYFYFFFYLFFFYFNY